MNVLASWETATIIFGILTFIYVMRDYMPEVSFGVFKFKSLRGYVSGITRDISVLDQVGNRINTLDYLARRDMRHAINHVVRKAIRKNPKEERFIQDIRYHLSTAICDNHVSFELSLKDYFAYPKKKFQEIVDACPIDITDAQKEILHYVVFGSWHMILSVQHKTMQMKIEEYELVLPMFQSDANRENCQKRIDKNKGYIEIINKTFKELGKSDFQDTHPKQIERAIETAVHQIPEEDDFDSVTATLQRVRDLITNR